MLKRASMAEARPVPVPLPLPALEVEVDATFGWLASAGGFTGAAWFAPIDPARQAAAVLIVPGIAHEERTMADGLVALARSLARAGHGTLLIDLHGTSQSTGTLAHDDIGERWRDDVRAALHSLREAGYAKVIVVGARLGALIALDACRDERLAGVVAWAPVVSGRRHVRELKVLQGATSSTADTARGAIAIAGHSIPRTVQARLAQLDFAALAPPAAAPFLLLDAADRLQPRWADAFTEAGTAVDRRAATQIDRWLFEPDRPPATPDADIAALTAWCVSVFADATPALAARSSTSNAGASNAAASNPSASTSTASSEQAGRPSLATEIEFGEAGRRVRERAVRIEPQGLSGIVSEPADAAPEGVARLLATLVGPGRIFPELARAEAARGRVSLRFDFAGFSTSARRADGSGAALYALDNRRDVTAALAHLRHSGHPRVAMVGFCAGAWSMVHAGARPGVAAVVGVNVAFYRQPDYRLSECLLAPGHVASKLLSLLRRIERAAGLVDALERRSLLALNPSGWLRRLCTAQTPLMLAYSTSDPGLVHLKHRLGKDLAPHRAGGRVLVKRYHGLGHLMEGAAPRAEAVDDIVAFLHRVDEHDPAAAAAQDAARQRGRAGAEAHAHAQAHAGARSRPAMTFANTAADGWSVSR